jgi:hypothetical protein
MRVANIREMISEKQIYFNDPPHFPDEGKKPPDEPLQIRCEITTPQAIPAIVLFEKRV